jgi:AmmeMemoRadiSam system protein B
VQLPFLQEVLGAFTIVPLLVGRCDTQQAAGVFDSLWDERTLLLISTDLSHYLPYEAAVRLDRQTARAIERLDHEAIGPQQACGCYALRGALSAARRRRLGARTLDLRTSGDTAGPRDSVVGYGAFALHTPSGSAAEL